jgi:NAD(P)-dependent dehydrogenase (short-subunit alcohol dehydrogenase family)
MKVAIADVNEAGLQETARQVAAVVGQANVLAVPTDVSKFESVVQFREKVYEAFGEVSPKRLLYLKATRCVYWQSSAIPAAFRVRCAFVILFARIGRDDRLEMVQGSSCQLVPLTDIGCGIEEDVY